MKQNNQVKNSLNDQSVIVSVKIYPGIGIARVGNSPDDFFIGPEAPWEEPNLSGKYKDAMGRVKRQAARFRIFGYDSAGKVIGELTASDCVINWSAHLSNKKAAYYKFKGRFHQDFTTVNLRNNADNADKRLPDERKEWIIDPGVRFISGVKQSPVIFDGGMIKDVPVTLGELRTDEKGRLLVLGGLGTSASLITDNPISEYANNDNWYDDTADGPVTATVTLPDGRVLEADSSWVIAAPPKFAPNTYNLVTLYDRIKERSDLPVESATLFYRDIYPILYRASGYAWVNGMSYRAHGAGKGGNFLSDSMLAVLSDKGVKSKEMRNNVFKRIRKPIDWEIVEGKVTIKNEEAANAQANYLYMPQLSGDDGDAITFPLPEHENPDSNDGLTALTWLTVIPSQYMHLQNWANGNFEKGEKETYIPLDEFPIAKQPEMLDRGVLEYCVGGPFYPGIEMTFISDENESFRAPFRLSQKFKAGDVTRYMALPWQADFFECNTHWWPAQRPDNVISEESYAEARKVLKNYKSTDKTIDPETVYALALADRVFWARGISDDPNDFATGDNNMVKYWHEMGFVTKQTTPGIDYNGELVKEEVYIEQERNQYAGMITDRELFYMIQNIDNFPGIMPKVKDYVEQVLQDAFIYGHADDTPEQMKFFKYTPENFQARMMDAYNSFVTDARSYDPATDAVFKTRKDCITRIIQFAPFNLIDGAWLRHIDKAGPTDEVQSLLSSIFQDERGNGDPSMNHCNIYLDLCHSVGYYPHPVDSEAFAQDPIYLDSAFTVAVFELAISQYTESYLPEILGMSLYLEWSVLELKPTIQLLEYFGIDPHFYVMHVGIDNAVNGHGRRAIDAIILYLSDMMQKGGEEAVQTQFERIWKGYIAFSLAGTFGQDLNNMIINAPSLNDQMVAMVEKKAAFGSLNHDKHMVGSNKINDWFSDPQGFLDELVSAGYIVPGNIEGSKFFSLIEFQKGPMFRVFSDQEIQLWKDWTLSLVKKASTKPLDSFDSMVLLLKTLKGQQQGNEQHNAIEIMEAGKNKAHPISWWFTQDPAFFMAALSDVRNNLIVPYDPDSSLFVTQLIASSNRMGQAFNYVIQGTGDQTGRGIVIQWINDGCPLTPVIHPKSTGFTAISNEKLWLTSSPEKFALHVSKKITGMGSIH
jgi:hypothetical protein